jgi:hypothetical protein
MDETDFRKFNFANFPGKVFISRVTKKARNQYSVPGFVIMVN